MSIQFSSVIPAQTRDDGRNFSVKSIDLDTLGVRASPVAVLDDFLVRGQPFAPHPHAGFSAVTYVLEDSPTGLRSRDSLGHDVVVGPGGIVWTQAGRGMMHEELPAEPDRALHGVQIFVNLSATNKLAAPQLLQLANDAVEEWRNDAGDRVRIVVGSYSGIVSPLVPAEPFDLLDVHLQREITYSLREGHNAVVYVLAGAVAVGADGRQQAVSTEHAMALTGEGSVRITATPAAHLLVLSGAEICEPVVVDGPFIMNEAAQIKAALTRYRAGDMGRLAPASAA